MIDFVPYQSINRDKGMSLVLQLSFIFHFMWCLRSDDFVITGDFFKDLQEEFKNWEASAASQGKPKSLWEELSVRPPANIFICLCWSSVEDSIIYTVSMKIFYIVNQS